MLSESVPPRPNDPSDPDVDALMHRLDALQERRPPSEPSTPERLSADVQALLDRLDPASTPPRSDPTPDRPDPASVPSISPARPAQGPSALAAFGVDLTAQARTKSPVFAGRDEEIDTVLEALCRRRKANPLLLGPPGSGKTALVEAVAARIAHGNVPAPLGGQRVIAISTGALIAGGGVVGEVEARVEALLQEASSTDVILFFDEVHTLMGAGGKEGTGDVASLIKPALARGDLRCIAATTDDEYHRFIKNDAALDRRFLPIRLRPLTARETRQVLGLLRDAEMGADDTPILSDQVLDAMVDRMERVLPNRHFPDKAIDLFDQVLAHARLRMIPEVSIAIVEAVAERMAGIPASPSKRLEQLAEELRRGQWCSDDEIDALTERLSITLRGLDLHTDRPNLVAAVTAQSLDRVRGFAHQLAVSLYGDEQRVLEVDGSTLASESSLASLVGTSAGYVGYGDRHLLAALADQPCHVLLVHGLDHAHPAVSELLTQAIGSGWITDQRNRRIAFSESVVLQWRAVEESARSVVGFSGGSRERSPVRESVAWRIDLTIALGNGDQVGAVLDLLARRWAEGEGVRLVWTPALREWVASSSRGHGSVEAFIDQQVAGPLWRLLRERSAAEAKVVVVDVRHGVICVMPESDPASVGGG